MSSWRINKGKRVLIDNGAFRLKVGTASSFSKKKATRVYNFIAKDKQSKTIYVGDQIENRAEHRRLEFIYPMIRGLLHDSDLQEMLWKHSFASLGGVTPSDSCLCLALSPFAPNEIKERIAEMAFEDFGFDALYLTMTTNMVQQFALNKNKEELNPHCQLVIESGFSFTHIVPYFNGYPINYAARRIDVGGKILTNFLKEIISYREYNMMDETLLVSQIKEAACRVSLNVEEELEIFREKVHEYCTKEYVLPDYQTIKKGYVRDREPSDKLDKASSQTLKLSHAMFTVPETLFSPADIGIMEAGVSEAVVQAVNKCPKVTQPLMYENLIVAGGTMSMPGFQDRLVQDLEKMIPPGSEIGMYNNFKYFYKVKTYSPELAAWKGLKLTCGAEGFEDFPVKRADYEEEGTRILQWL